MRALFRLFAMFLAVAAITLAGSSSALAAGSPSSESLAANWCFQDGSVEYCFDVTGHVHYLDNKGGSSLTLQETTRTTVYESGQYVGESTSVQQLRGVFGADGTIVLASRIHTRSSVGEEDCVYRMVLKLVDYEATVYHVTSTCGGPA